MKILCIQLARLGDILLSAPALHALKREEPDSRIDILVRPRFAAAAGLFPWLNVRTFDTGEILQPLLLEGGVEASQEKLRVLVEELKNEKYDLILNFTFSPFSSYLTALLSEGGNSRGYTRFGDGSFAVTDFISGYFYSQVGIGRPNRLHVSDIFAAMAGTSLSSDDWPLFERVENPSGVIFHVGASHASKSLSPGKTAMILSSLQERGVENITLVGSAGEIPLANQILARLERPVVNLCGRTDIRGLRDAIASAELVIGADSAPMHFATLAGVPCLNISFPSVNFFETAPRSAGSRVLFADSDETLLSHIAANEACGILNQRPPALCVAESLSPLEPLQAPRWNRLETEWALVKSAYFRIPFDSALRGEERRGIEELRKLNDIILLQYGDMESKPQNIWAGDLVRQAEVLFAAVTDAAPSLRVLARWLSASRATVGPGSAAGVREKYVAIHRDLAAILEEISPSEEKEHGDEKISAG
jgi:ADP-heptose:LPS heptosyltransferase